MAIATGEVQTTWIGDLKKGETTSSLGDERFP